MVLDTIRNRCGCPSTSSSSISTVIPSSLSTWFGAVLQKPFLPKLSSSNTLESARKAGIIQTLGLCSLLFL
jgi:hypothetical protein